MKTAVCYYSRHHGNTRKVLEAMAREGDVDLIDVTQIEKGSEIEQEIQRSGVALFEQ